jgi:hypothetical protein
MNGRKLTDAPTLPWMLCEQVPIFQPEKLLNKATVKVSWREQAEVTD